MVMTSTDIQNQSFSIDRKGYDVDEVDVFLEQVAHELDEMNTQIAQLQSDLDNARFGGLDTSPSNNASADDLADKDARIAELEALIEEKKADDNAIAQALIIAQRSAEEIRAKAKDDAAQTKEEAEAEAQRILEEANGDKQKVLDDIDGLEEDREKVRTEYATMLKDFSTSVNKKLAQIGSTALGNHASARKAAESDSSALGQTPIKRDASAKPATYSTPQKTGSVVASPATPKPSKVEKDLSGFGDADSDLDIDEID